MVLPSVLHVIPITIFCILLRNLGKSSMFTIHKVDRKLCVFLFLHSGHGSWLDEVTLIQVTQWILKDILQGVWNHNTIVNSAVNGELWPQSTVDDCHCKPKCHKRSLLKKKPEEQRKNVSTKQTLIEGTRKSWTVYQYKLNSNKTQNGLQRGVVGKIFVTYIVKCYAIVYIFWNTQSAV